ncbi:hypothetical protein BKA82DRAFT_3143931 [Pisolithus tinctorius]|nr:hypothetical protein BKA82DRAFT_3143931 [Pisolithus tinctorius]
MTCNLFVGSHPLDAARDPRLEVVLPQLCRRFQTLSDRDNKPHRYAEELQKVQNELKSIAHSLSVGVSVATGKRWSELTRFMKSYSNTERLSSEIYTLGLSSREDFYYIGLFRFSTMQYSRSIGPEIRIGYDRSAPYLLTSSSPPLERRM